MSKWFSLSMTYQFTTLLQICALLSNPTTSTFTCVILKHDYQHQSFSLLQSSATIYEKKSRSIVFFQLVPTAHVILLSRTPVKFPLVALQHTTAHARWTPPPGRTPGLETSVTSVSYWCPLNTGWIIYLGYTCISGHTRVIPAYILSVLCS